MSLKPGSSPRVTKNERLTIKELQKFMNYHGISIKEMSEILGVTPQAVNLWLNGQREISVTLSRLVRMFMKYPDAEKWPAKHDLSNIRILGTVDEPINEDAWMWYFENIGGGRCPVIDTWWQTETGGTLINALPGIGPFIPTVAGRSFPGTKHEVLNEKGESVAIGEGGYLVQRGPFAPGMLRGVYKSPERYKQTYWSEYGDSAYFTSDGARIWDELGNIRLTGRVDDVMKVAGHRLSTAELENAIGGHPLVAENAVVAAPHEIKGEIPIAFVILKEVRPSEELKKELIKQVDKVIGVTARPGEIIFVEDLPKTRSGKIMRRILKSLVKNERIGNITTLSNPESISHLKERMTDIK